MATHHPFRNPDLLSPWILFLTVFSSTSNLLAMEVNDFLTFASRGDVALLSSISLMILTSRLSIFRNLIATFVYINQTLAQFSNPTHPHLLSKAHPTYGHEQAAESA